MPSGALPETFPKTLEKLATDTIRSMYKLALNFSRCTLATYSNTTQLCKVTMGNGHYSEHKNTIANNNNMVRYRRLD